MKNQFTLMFLGLLISASVFCQPPQAFKYQAVIRDATGEILSEQAVDIRISIRNETPSGTVVYQETFSETTNQFGLVNLNIGLGSPLIGIFMNIDWRNDSKFIEVEIDNGDGYTSLGISELFSVPYSLYSGSSTDSYWGLYNSSVYYNSGNVGIGTSNPDVVLHVEDRIRVGKIPPNFVEYGELIHEGNGTGFRINAHAGGGGWADMLFQTNGTTKMFLESSGRFGIGTTNPWAGLHLKGNEYPNSFMFLQSETGGDAGFRLYEGDEVKWHIFNKSATDAFYIYNSDNTHTVFCADQSTGNVGIGSITPNAKLHVNDRIRVGEDPSYGTVYGELYHEGAGTGFKINAHAGGGSWADMYFQTNGTTKMFIESAGNVGIGTTIPSSKLDVRGNITVRNASTGSIVMELGTGLDYAEGFDVSNNFEIEPGTILCIDIKNPGQLKVSEKPYDKTVAGIVAGANGLGSGVRLGTEEFDCDVALAGRVYCNTIATTEDIEPGDLLTTSSIPGYAMKVMDFTNSQGAILGKAMESLKKGEKGQILVLVTLQ